MIVYKEKDRRKWEGLIGKPLKSGIKGTPSFFIETMIIDTELDELKSALIQFKCVFQVHEEGILITFFKSDKRYFIPLLYNDIYSVILKKGDEYINPITFSPMGILLKFGVSIEIARYFRRTVSEYQIGDTEAHLVSNGLEMKIFQNGYTYKAVEIFFRKCDLKEKLKI